MLLLDGAQMGLGRLLERVGPMGRQARSEWQPGEAWSMCQEIGLTVSRADTGTQGSTGN